MPELPEVKRHLAELGANDVPAVILCDNQGQRDRLFELLGDTGADLAVGLVTAGFTLREAGLAVLTDHEVFARYKRRRRRLRRTGGLSIQELSALKVGDFVVHEDHGIGVYRGMRRLTLNGQETDCIEIAYAATDRLFVPVHQLALGVALRRRRRREAERAPAGVGELAEDQGPRAQGHRVPRFRNHLLAASTTQSRHPF